MLWILASYVTWKLTSAFYKSKGGDTSTTMGGSSSKVLDDAAKLAREVRRLRAALDAATNNQGGGGHQQPYAAPPVVQAGGGGGGGFHDVLFFPDKQLPCRNGPNCRRQRCEFSHQPTSLSRFLSFLGSARSTLDVCVFTVTSDDIAQALIALHRRGVKVRVITDDEQVASTGSDIAELQRAGIPVVTDRAAGPGHLLHHKFCVLDGRLVANGSFNWTRQAVLANNEDVVITDAPGVVRAFAARFEQLWRQYGGR